jgi:hypothetical protein
MLTTTRSNGEFIPSSRVSPLTAVDLLVQFLDHRHRSSAHSILVPVPILLDVPILRSSLAPRPHTSSSRLRSAPSCRRFVAAAIGCLLAAALTAATGRALLMLDQPILLVVALLLLAVRRRRLGRHLMAACASVCAHHGVPSATAALGLAHHGAPF